MIATLARASVEGAILVTLVWLLARLLRLSPATRTVLWWCAAAKFVIALVWMAPLEIPVLPVQSPGVVVAARRVTSRPILESAAPATSTRRQGAAASDPGLRASVTNGLREWSSFAAIGWMLGLAAAAFVGMRRWRETARMPCESVPAAEVVQVRAAELATRLGLRRVPEVRVSACAETPLVMGLLRPVVLLPGNRLDTLTDDQQRMVICHELAHLKRADLWLGCIPALAERMFFFHPLAHVASREYALAREAACDASVMRTLDAAPQEYGRVLLALGVSPSRPGLTAAGAAWSFQNLKRRIAMLQDISVRSTRSRLLTAAIVGLAVAALVPLRLVARPARAQDAPVAARPTAAADEGRELAKTQTSKDEQTVKSERRKDETGGLRFVLISEDGSRTTAGAFESEDIARAERQRRGGEALLWVRDGDKEYVIRDSEVLREARSLWSDVYRPDFDADSVRKLTQAVESLKVDELAEQGALMAQRLVDSALLADQAQLIAEQGRQAAEIGLAVAEQVLRGLADGGFGTDGALEQQLKSIDKLDIEQHLHSVDKLSEHLNDEIEHTVRDLEHRMKGDFDSQLKELHEQLSTLEQPMKDLAEPMKDFGHHMDDFGRAVGEAAREATERMRALIEQAIKNGQAIQVR